MARTIGAGQKYAGEARQAPLPNLARGLAPSVTYPSHFAFCSAVKLLPLIGAATALGRWP